MKKIKSVQINRKHNHGKTYLIDPFDIMECHFGKFIMLGDLSRSKIILEKFPIFKENLTMFFPSILHSFFNKENIEETGDNLEHKYHEQLLIGKRLRNYSLDFLIENGLKVDDLDEEGQTLLHVATYYGEQNNDLTILHSLVSNYNYPTSLLNKECQTSLQVAIKNGNFFSAMYLLSRGSDILHIDNYGKDAWGYVDEFIAYDLSNEPGCERNLACKEELYRALNHVIDGLPLLISKHDFKVEDWINLYPIDMS